jgi:spore maturation protein CgeB
MQLAEKSEIFMLPKKILILYSSQPPIIDDLSVAFHRLGVQTDYVYVDETHWFDRWVIRKVNKQLHNFRILPKNRVVFAEHPWAHLNYRSAKVAAKVAEFQPDLVFMIRGINFTHDLMASLPNLYGWWIEREERVGEAIREAKYFAWYFFISRAATEATVSAGFSNASYQSHVVNPERFRQLANSTAVHDVCFVGNWSKHRQKHLEAILEVTPNVAIYGRKWIRNNLTNRKILSAVKGRWIDGEALNKLYNQSKIVLNVTNWGSGSGKARSGMNMRIFEVPASGAFLLTDESRELEEFLQPGEHIGVYGDQLDLQTQVRRYLAAPDERQVIAAQGCEHVRKNYTYDLVAQRVIEAYQKVKLGGGDAQR